MHIEFEGIDNSGKTTQCSLLQKWFERKNIPHRMVKEPSGSPLGKQVMKLLIDEKLDARTLMFMFLAIKSDLHQRTILPYLRRGFTILADRGSGSFLSYHQVGVDVNNDDLQRLLSIAVNRHVPDLIILLDIPPEVAMSRGNEVTASFFDSMPLEVFEAQRQAYLELSKNNDSWVCLDATVSIQSLHSQILDIVEKKYLMVCT